MVGTNLYYNKKKNKQVRIQMVYICMTNAKLSVCTYITYDIIALLCKDCKTPEQPANGVVELTVDLLTTYGATAIVTCNTGYELRGNGFLWCNANGVWSALPSCNIKGNLNKETLNTTLPLTGNYAECSIKALKLSFLHR